VRLAILCLTCALALSAQAPVPSGLPWRAAGALPWQMDAPDAPPEPMPAASAQTDLPLTVRMAMDGHIRVTDAKGLIRMRLGLPGRPLKAWRDGGVPVPDLKEPLRFPAHTPLQLGLGGMPVGALDFRPALEGLLWILDDDENILTVLHPATAQVAYLDLPGGQDLTLVFRPDRLELQDAGVPGSCWTLSWLALLPQFIQLGVDTALHQPRGTALLPFPRE